MKSLTTYAFVHVCGYTASKKLECKIQPWEAGVGSLIPFRFAIGKKLLILEDFGGKVS